MGTPTHDSHAHSRLDSCCWRLTRPVSGSVKWANHSPGMYWEASVLEDVLEGGAVDSEGIPGRGPWLSLGKLPRVAMTMEELATGVPGSCSTTHACQSSHLLAHWSQPGLCRGSEGSRDTQRGPKPPTWRLSLADREKDPVRVGSRDRRTPCVAN